MILAGDIGGTKTNLAYFSDEQGKLVPQKMKSYRSKEHHSLADIVRMFVEEFPQSIECAAFGVAGPVIEGRCQATNLSWVVDSKEMAKLLGLQTTGLINDLEATAYGTLRLDEKDWLLLAEGIPRVRTTKGVIAAGTGLGEGGLVWNGTRYHALASEGGHSDFGPRNELEIDLLRFLLQRFQRVSYERLVSGPGMYNVYQFFRSRSKVPEPSWLTGQIKTGDPAAAISTAALEGKDQVCLETLEMFVSLYGAEAGNLALKLLTTGGMYVGGGIAPKILPKIQHGAFIKSFTNKGRYSSLLKDVPVYVVLNDKTALYGAAHYAQTTQR